ncbi:MAG: hypothetical protein AB1779_03495 [Candidatus Thermoplasmatota archaeon]
MIEVSVRCPYCKKTLMDEEKKIDDRPSVRVMIQVGDKTGILHLSSLYGSYNIWCEFDIPMGAIATFLCPHCMANLKSTMVCERCDAPMVFFEFHGAGIIKICARRGCKKHLIAFDDIEKEIIAFYEEFPLFFKDIVRKGGE